MLAGGQAAFPGCAEDGFRAVFANNSVPLALRWGGSLGLQGLLAAEGRTTELRALVDSAVAGGMDLANQLYLLDALAGVDVDADAAAVAERLSREGAANVYPFTLWLLGAWYARHGNHAETEAMRAALAARQPSPKDPWTGRFADVLTARLLLLKGDSAGAIGRLRPALSVGQRRTLDWDLGESLAPDRLLLAELLLARGQPAEAMSAAGVFDHQAPAVFLPFLPASLALRSRAAVALGRADDARRFQERLVALGQGGTLAHDSSLSPNMEAP